MTHQTQRGVALVIASVAFVSRLTAVVTVGLMVLVCDPKNAASRASDRSTR